MVPAVEAAAAAATFVGATGAAAAWQPLTEGTMAIPTSAGMGLYKKCRLYLSIGGWIGYGCLKHTEVGVWVYVWMWFFV